MTRVWVSLLLLLLLSASVLPVKGQQQVQEPPEEDAGPSDKQYSFNPLQAQKELKIGGFYFKKGSYRAAARRFEEAVKWEPSNAGAYLRLAETHTKLSDKAAARQAYEKYLELQPEGKQADAIRKKLSASPEDPR